MEGQVFEMPASCISCPLHEELISIGHKVILKKDKFYKIVTIQADRLELCEKRKFRLTGAVGKPYESLFLIEGENLVHIKNRYQYEDFESPHVLEDVSKGAVQNTKDNRNLTASPSNQSLLPADISQMRAEGKTGAEIVSQLVENSSSFADKTAFSQAKYLKKKRKKHMELVTILRPTTRNLCQMYSARGIQKILGLRMDTLAFMLAHGNVHCGANVLVHETCAGLLLGAVLERLGGEGRLLQFHHGTAPVRPESHDVLTAETQRLLMDIPLQEATALRLTCNFATHAVGEGSGGKKRRLANTEEAKEEEEEEEEEKEIVLSGDRLEANSSQPASSELKHKGSKTLSAEEQERRRMKRRNRLNLSRTALLYEPWNSLLVATKFHPTVPVLTLLHFLSPGAPFAVYCQRMEPLADLLNCLKRRGEVVMVELSEGWMRPYQVLPNRTHPEMTLQGGGGGYVLTGYKTCGPFGKARAAEADYEEGILCS